MLTAKIVKSMIEYFGEDVPRVNHFLKVLEFARVIGKLEGLDERTQAILEAAAATHDIGIKQSELKFGNASGYHQQIEGPPEARKLLESTDGADKELIERVCYLISRHHRYNNIDGLDCQILIEADIIVNAFEDENMSIETMRDLYEKIFKTETGKSIFKSLAGANIEVRE